MRARPARIGTFFLRFSPAAAYAERDMHACLPLRGRNSVRKNRFYWNLLFIRI